MAGKYQSYEEYKDSGAEWLGAVPSEWNVMQLRRITHLQQGLQIPQDKRFHEAGHNRVEYITIKYLNSKDPSQAEYILSASDRVLCNEDDVLLARTGATGQVVTGVNGAFHNNFFKVNYDRNKVTKEFLVYFLSVKEVLGHLLMLAGTTTIPDLNHGAFLGTKIAIPDFMVQAGVVDFLDHETAKIDTLIEKQQQLIALLKEKRQAVISHAVTKGLNPNAPMRDSGVEWLGEVPEHWEVAKVKYFASIQGGYAFSSESFQEGGVQLLRIGNMYLNRLALERQPTFVDELFVESHKNFSVRRGDILMSLTGTLGKTDYGFAVHVDEDGPFMLNQRVAKITPRKTKIAPEYLIYAIRSESYLKQLYSLPSGTKQANLSNDDVTNIPIVVPPTIEEQLLVARYISDNLGKYNKVIDQSDAAIKLMQERRTALISAAVTGKIDVRNWSTPEENKNKEVA
jgi:type I restriction enzyme S subunit